jgi:hypothetical protein
MPCSVVAHLPHRDAARGEQDADRVRHVLAVIGVHAGQAEVSKLERLAAGQDGAAVLRHAELPVRLAAVGRADEVNPAVLEPGRHGILVEVIFVRVGAGHHICVDFLGRDGQSVTYHKIPKTLVQRIAQ